MEGLADAVVLVGEPETSAGLAPATGLPLLTAVERAPLTPPILDAPADPGISLYLLTYVKLSEPYPILYHDIKSYYINKLLYSLQSKTFLKIKLTTYCIFIKQLLSSVFDDLVQST